ncbi:MAG: phosphatidate cytidylyltransferase [Pseudoflavonifractor sp.]|nr:phosphatidate cytidylyltransferase [Alloprevotella sp.]MCM1115952.1 phosphatidate cytidylyltransferase [Pseudoflavonifractor sp.]
MPNIIVRALSGAVYVALILGSLLLSPRLAFPLLMMVFAILGSLEYSRMTGENRLGLRIIDASAAILPALFVLLVVSSFWALPWAYGAASLLLLYPFVRLAAELFGGSDTPLERGAISCLGVGYVGLPLGMVAYGAAIMPSIVILMMAMIWLNDTGAYLVGRTWGHTKLLERISPKKTREGAAGGILASMAAGAVAPLLFDTLAITSTTGLLFGLAVAVASIIGDLVESMIKREEGVKDSGAVIPGHGGILDRIDSLLFVAPVTLLFIFWIVR